MSIDNDNLWGSENTNTGARGDCIYLPLISMISERAILDFNDNKTKHSESTVDFEYPTDKCFRSDLASGDPEVCFSTSSATFIVSSSSPSEIIIQQDNQNIHNASNTNMELFPSTRSSNNHQEQLWYKKHWIPMTIIIGIIIIFITIIATTIIH